MKFDDSEIEKQSKEVATPAAVDLAAPLTCCMRAVVIHHGRGLGTAPIGRFCGHVVW